MIRTKVNAGDFLKLNVGDFTRQFKCGWHIINSNINEVIRAISNLFIFLLRENFTCTKSTKRKQATFTQTFFTRIKSIKSIKSTKSTKRQTSDFLPLRCFYAHKNAVFFVSHTKKHKKHKKHIKSIKMQISE